MEEQDQYAHVVTPEITAGYKVTLVQQLVFFFPSISYSPSCY